MGNNIENNMENRKIQHTEKKFMLTDLKNTENLLLIIQRMHQYKNIPGVGTFWSKLLLKHRDSH